MSNVNVSVSGPASATRRATGAGPETGRGGKGRWSAKRKASVVLELLRGADLESTSRKYGVTAATLSEWRDAFLAAALRRSKSGQWPGSTSRAGGRRESSPRWPWRMSSCASASGAWRTRSLFCGGGRGNEPRPLGLHRSHVRAPLGC